MVQVLNVLVYVEVVNSALHDFGEPGRVATQLLLLLLRLLLMVVVSSGASASVSFLVPRGTL